MRMRFCESPYASDGAMRTDDDDDKKYTKGPYDQY